MMRNSKIQFYFMISVVISVYTQLRFGMFGFGEVILLFLFSFALFYRADNSKKANYKPYTFSILFFSFLVLCFIAIFLNFFNVTIFHGKSDFGFSFDLMSYCFVFIVLYTLESLIFSGQIQPKRLLNSILNTLFYSSFFLFLLFKFVTSNLGGFKLNTYSYFAPLVENVHQFSMVACLLPVFYASRLLESEDKYNKVKFLIFTVLSLVMIMETNAFKAFIGSFLGVILLLFFNVFNSVTYRNKIFIFSLTIIFVPFYLFFYLGAEFFIDLFNGADGGGARANLYTNGFLLFLDSPLFGYGPGGHLFLNNQYSDSHQTILTIALQTGIAGVVLFSIFTYILVRVILKSEQKFIYFSLLIPIFMYVMGGDILRKYQIWVFLCLIYYSSIYEKEPIKT